MNRWAFLIPFVFVLSFLSVSAAVSEPPIPMNFGPSVEVPADEVISGDYLCAGASIVIDGTIEGNLTAWGASVVVNGEVKGDANISAGSIVVIGNIGGDVNLSAGAVVIDATVGGDLTASAGSIKCSGDISGDVSLTAGQVDLSATVAGNATLNGIVKIHPQAVINGNLYYSPKTELHIADGAIVKGEQIIQIPEKEKFDWTGYIFNKIWFFIALLVIGLFLFLFYKPGYRQIITDLTQKPLKDLLFGLCIFIIMPVVALLLIITVIGILLGVILLLAYFILLLLALVLSSTLLGEWILTLLTKKKSGSIHLLLALLVGCLVFVLLTCIPFAAGFFYLLGFFLGMGVLWHLYLQKRKTNAG
jgi:cytoskeletal protein CcmA (bactofilin family)